MGVQRKSQALNLQSPVSVHRVEHTGNRIIGLAGHPAIQHQSEAYKLPNSGQTALPAQMFPTSTRTLEKRRRRSSPHVIPYYAMQTSSQLDDLSTRLHYCRYSHAELAGSHVPVTCSALGGAQAPRWPRFSPNSEGFATAWAPPVRPAAQAGMLFRPQVSDTVSPCSTLGFAKGWQRDLLRAGSLTASLASPVGKLTWGRTAWRGASGSSRGEPRKDRTLRPISTLHASAAHPNLISY